MGEGDKTLEKPTADVYSFLYTGTYLIQFYLTRQGAKDTFIQNPPEKNRAREPLFPLGVWMTRGSQ